LVFARVRRIGQVAVLMLLAWTAVDLINPALCGLDELPFVAAGTTVAPDGDVPVERPPADDCFCCSPNVNCTAIVSVESTPSFGLQAARLTAEPPRWAGTPLYHPPRLLS